MESISTFLQDEVYFFTLLYEITIRVPLETSAQCQIAIRANEPLSKELNDVDMYCIDTGRISKSIRPKLRP